MADHPSDSHEHAEGDHNHGGVFKYVVVFGLLCGLTAISFYVGNAEWIMSTPSIGWAAMMAVSCGKAMLVIMFFMHLKWEANWKYVLTVPASVMSVFLVLMLIPDIGRRTNYYNLQRELFAAPSRTSETEEAPTGEEPAHSPEHH